MDLTGKVALVTGGASGIGAAAVRRLAAAGARVGVVDRDVAGAVAMADEVDGLALPRDVADPDGMPAVVAGVERAFGRLDVVLLNAGVVAGQSGVENLDIDRYRRIVGVNIDHVVFGLADVVPALRRAGGGRVVATASVAGLIATVDTALSTMTKHAVVGYVRAAGRTLAREGIRVNALCPGLVDTPMITRLKPRLGSFPLLTPDDVADALEAVLEHGGPGECWYVVPGREPAPYEFREVLCPPGAAIPSC